MEKTKFRFWDEKEKVMYPTGTINLFLDSTGDIFCYYDGKFEEVKNMKILQYTGLNDTNDVDICEGDILEDFIGKQRYEVIWDDYGMFLFNPVGTEGNAIDYYEFTDEACMSTTIVIGNIYENPDLIKEFSTFND